MNKKALTEADIRSKFITPALVGPNGGKWNLMTQIREEAFFTRGRVIVRGKTVTRGKAKKADYLLSYKPNLPLAVVEAKDNHHSVGAGMQQALLDELGTQGVFFEELAALVGRDYDAFDLICHVAFDRPPRTRQERAAQVKKRDVFARYGIKVRAVLDALLAKYADGGIRSVESLEILKVEPLSTFGTPVEIVTLFGGKPAYLAAIRELETALYQEAA